MSKSGVACYRNGGCGPYEMYSCSSCPASKSDYVQFKRKPITNYDRIISKTPEELAMWINSIIKERNIEVTCDGWLEWLKKEADDGIL